jgi:hypothetical protein
MISVNSQVASAIRYANSLYQRLPDKESRDAFAEVWIDLERRVECAEVAGNIREIETLIEGWRAAVSQRFEELSS